MWLGSRHLKVQIWVPGAVRCAPHAPRGLDDPIPSQVVNRGVLMGEWCCASPSTPSAGTRRTLETLGARLFHLLFTGLEHHVEDEVHDGCDQEAHDNAR